VLPLLSWKSNNITYFECVFIVSDNLHAIPIHHVILSSVTCPAAQYFFTLSPKQQDFRKKMTEHKMYVLIFSTTFIRNISHSKKNRERDDKKCTLVFM
jgi:acyl-coenzyme A synthetase/AMP-(fatty) acid ligase